MKATLITGASSGISKAFAPDGLHVTGSEKFLVTNVFDKVLP